MPRIRLADSHAEGSGRGPRRAARPNSEPSPSLPLPLLLRYRPLVLSDIMSKAPSGSVPNLTGLDYTRFFAGELATPLPFWRHR